jgi:uncharacterized protein involved in exopolysaccharide biosynthesis
MARTSPDCRRMPEHLNLSHDLTPQPSPTVRDVLMVIFRHRRLFGWSFLIVFLVVIAYATATPRYEASMRVLVRRGRFDPPMTPQPSSQADFSRSAVSEEEVNSEVELLRDDEVLRRVAEKNGLAGRGLLASLHIQQDDVRAQIERAARKLAAQIIVEPIRKTSLIQVHYRSSDPGQAARVLNSLATEYSAKHAELHRPSGELEFFDQQISNSRIRLDEAEAALLQFTQREGFVAAPLERDAALVRLADADAKFRQLRQDISQSEQRVRTLHQQMITFPPRSTSTIRFVDNPELLEKLKSRLLELQLKRTELLTRYEPTYRLVQEMETEIGEAHAAIEREEHQPLRDETTEKDPNHEWAKAELEKAEVDLRSLQAGAGTAARELIDSRKQAQHLGAASIEQEDLQRAAKSAEETYLLYLRKREEARIGDALDAHGILNFTLAQSPVEPALPLRSNLSFGLIALAAAGLCSTGLAFAAEYIDPVFRSPDEVFAYLQAPVLATLPKERDAA